MGSSEGVLRAIMEGPAGEELAEGLVLILAPGDQTFWGRHLQTCNHLRSRLNQSPRHLLRYSRGRTKVLAVPIDLKLVVVVVVVMMTRSPH